MKSVICRHYRKAVGALVVYDVTKKSTFESITRWIKDLKASAEPDIVVMVAGNKVDLCEENPSLRQVTREEGEMLAESQGAMYEETSAVQDTNVKGAFENLMQSIQIALINIEIYENSQSNGPNAYKKGNMGEKLGATAKQDREGCSC